MERKLIVWNECGGGVMIKNLGFIFSIMRSYGNVIEGWYDLVKI